MHKYSVVCSVIMSSSSYTAETTETWLMGVGCTCTLSTQVDFNYFKILENGNNSQEIQLHF